MTAILVSLDPTGEQETAVKSDGTFDILIIGAGISGLSAGIYAARAGYSTLILEGALMSAVDYPGGQLMLTEDIENFPGFPSGSGSDLIFTVRQQAENFGANIREGRVESASFGVAGRKHKVVTDEGETFFAKKLILATGAIARRLEVPGEDKLFGRGVSSCATCDGAFFKDKVVAVVGGGDVAVEDALYLTQHATKVYLIHRRDELRSTSPQARTLLAHPKVTPVWNTQVMSINGMDEVESVSVASSDGNVEDIAVSGVFVAIGHDPQTELIEHTENAENTAHGYITLTPGGVKTSVDGFFVCGDVNDKVYRQAITAAASGAQAAIEATRELAGEGE